MKKRNIAAAILLASMMAVSTCAGTVIMASAADDATITINTATGDTQTHAYKAYEIITGDLAPDGTLINVAWGANVNPATFITQLKAFDANKSPQNAAIQALNDTTGSVSSAADVAAALTGYSDVEGLAKVFNEAGVITGSGTALPKSGSGNSATYGATGLANGWYLIKDTISLEKGTGVNEDKVRSANLLQVRGTTAITPNPKYSVPTLEKKILEGSPETPVDANQVSIGDTVKYQITVPVPDVTGYNKYFYVVNDTLSKGLTYTDNLTMTATGFTLTADADGHTTTEAGNYYVTSTVNGDGSTSLKIVFEDCVNTFKGQTGDIVITYTAKLNENAVITDEGNPNTAQLVYSNDPNHTYTGDTTTNPDEPKPPTNPNDPKDGDVTGVTPKDTVKTYTTAIKIKKVDNTGAPLTGAKFKIEGTTLNQVVVLKDTFTADNENGLYWKLNDNTYTTTDPATLPENSDARNKYVSETDKYTRTFTTETMGTGQTKTTVEAEVDGNGWLVFKGLEAGTYNITETQKPDSTYNDIDPFTVTISNDQLTEPNNPASAAAGPDLTSAHWKVVKDSVEVTAVEEGAFTFNVINSKGTTLPSTGGIGTTIFYVVGGTLVAGAVVLLITKKRMSINDQK